MAGRLTAGPTVAARTGVAASRWDDAVRAAVGPLTDAGAVSAHYAERCVEIVREQGPYIVVAPGIALAHARPEDGARRVALSAAVLAAPVPFGHPTNDPVDVVLAFASPDTQAHLALLAGLARRLASGLAGELRAAASDDDAAAVLQEVTR